MSVFDNDNDNEKYFILALTKPHNTQRTQAHRPLRSDAQRHNRCSVTQYTCDHRLTSHSNASLYRVANMTHIVITDSETTHKLLCSAAQGSEFHMYSVA